MTNDPLEPRIRELENWRNNTDKHMAVASERGKHLDKRFDTLETGLEKINAHIARLIWIFVVAFLSAGVAFVVSGGLNVSG